MPEKNTCISIYLAHKAAEQALGKLQTEGCDLQQISIVGKGYYDEEHPIGFYTVGDRICYWGLQSAFWHGLWGLLEGAAFFWVPGFGPLAAAGPIAALLVKGLEDVTIGGGFGVLGAALFGLGIPRNSIAQYEQAVKAEKILVIVHGKSNDVERACDILLSKTQQVAVHTA